MKVFMIFVSIIAASLANSVNILTFSQITREIITDQRYLVYEREDGFLEVEDLEYYNVELPPFFLKEGDVTFWFFNRENRHTGGIKINFSQLSEVVKLTRFNVKKNTLVIIHGWKNHGTSLINDLIKTSVLKNRKINVIVVDWSPIAKKGYTTAQGSVLAVGNYIGVFLLNLKNKLKDGLQQIDIVGHSLGAHIAGNAGARAKGLINTIIGLDPAGPLFSASNINNRLDPTDADYVHVIHTNNGYLGFDIKMGHADYYPNGGKRQPGCGVDLIGTCAHSRAYKYFAESLNSDNFISRICDGWSNYQKNRCYNNTVSHLGGFPVEKSSMGKYYLKTNKKSPFAQG